MPSENKKRILVVEDELDIRELLEIVLTIRGFQVALAENGRRGLETLTTFKPDLVLLDLAMPELDGIGFLKGKSELADHSTVPVIVLSARDKSRDAGLAIEMGADTYISKPFDTEAVISNVNRLLAKMDARAAPSA